MSLHGPRGQWIHAHGDLIVTHHQEFYLIPLMVIDHPEETLHRGLRILADLPLPLRYWVSSGTALGLYRDGTFIPGDTDIDLSIEMDIEDPLFDPNGLPFLEHVKNVAPSLTLIRSQIWRGKGMQFAFRDQENGNLVLDFYFFYRGLEEGFLVNHNDQGTIRKPVEIFEEIVATDTPYGKLPLPKDLVAYMKMRYGDSWRIPSGKKGIYGDDW